MCVCDWTSCGSLASFSQTKAYIIVSAFTWVILDQIGRHVNLSHVHKLHISFSPGSAKTIAKPYDVNQFNVKNSFFTIDRTKENIQRKFTEYVLRGDKESNNKYWSICIALVLTISIHHDNILFYWSRWLLIQVNMSSQQYRHQTPTFLKWAFLYKESFCSFVDFQKAFDYADHDFLMF